MRDLKNFGRNLYFFMTLKYGWSRLQLLLYHTYYDFICVELTQMYTYKQIYKYINGARADPHKTDYIYNSILFLRICYCVLDRLPESNSLESLRIIRDAWDHVEMYVILHKRLIFFFPLCLEAKVGYIYIYALIFFLHYCMHSLLQCHRYHEAADSYKLVAKIAFVALILIAIGITLLSMLEVAAHLIMSRLGIIIASFIGTALVGYVTFTNPVMKWQQLR